MSKLSNANKTDILTEFQNFLLGKKLALEETKQMIRLKHYSFSSVCSCQRANEKASEPKLRLQPIHIVRK
jgi:hypothetical protein